MFDEWPKYKKILEQEDEELKKAMEAEVSTLFCPRFSSKYGKFDRDRHYCPFFPKIYNFQFSCDAYLFLHDNCEIYEF